MNERFDVIIVGGGMAGMSLGCALAGAGVETAVIEQSNAAEKQLPAFDGRTTSIAHGSAQVLKGIGLWPLLEADAEPILDIRIADGHPSRGVSPLFLHFDHTEVGTDSFGYIIENRLTHAALFRLSSQMPSLTLVAPATVERAERKDLMCSIAEQGAR